MKFILAIVLLAMSSFASASGWLVKVDGDYTRHDQCNILVDSVIAGGRCNHRLSVMCLSGGVGGSAGASNWDSPIVLPYTMLLQSEPNVVVGSITIVSLPATGNATIGLNGEPPTSDWVPAATYAGQSCDKPVSNDGGITPNGTSMARFCQQYPEVPACRSR